MTDHRKLQRTLFRMHLDADFAQAVLARNAEALGSTGLGTMDLELLMGLDPRALRADPGGRRRSQFLGNSASEFTLSLAAASAHASLADLLDGFASCPEFHGALETEARLPMAFGAYAMRRAKTAKAKDVEAMLSFELAMAQWRRPTLPPTIPNPHPLQGLCSEDPPAAATVPGIPSNRTQLEAGCVRLVPGSCLVRLPLGTFNRANALQASLESGATDVQVEQPRSPASGEEVVLLKRGPQATPFQLPRIEPELLTSPTDELLSLAETPLSQAQRVVFAESQGAAPEALEAFVAELVSDGVLELGDPGTA